MCAYVVYLYACVCVCLIQALENVSPLSVSACEQRLLHMIWARCIEYCGLEQRICGVCVCGYVDSGRCDACPCVCVREGERENATLRLKVCLCVCVRPGWSVCSYPRLP